MTERGHHHEPAGAEEALDLALRDRVEAIDGRRRHGPKPAPLAVQETLAELRQHRRPEPMVDLMDRPIPGPDADGPAEARTARETGDDPSGP